MGLTAIAAWVWFGFHALVATYEDRRQKRKMLEVSAEYIERHTRDMNDMLHIVRTGEMPEHLKERLK